MNIYVGNLPFSTTEAELQNEFGQFGAVTRAQVMIDRLQNTRTLLLDVYGHGSDS